MKLQEQMRVGRWTLCWPCGYKAYGKGKHKFAYWLCVCDCGNMSVLCATSLRQGRSRSCGCLSRELLKQHNVKIGWPIPTKATHGHCRRGSMSSEYSTWSSMLRRCESPRNRSYVNYGGRGITVCERWHKFERFFEDIGPKPSPEMRLERVNNNGNYEPSNCRWATPKEQRSNQRSRINPGEAFFQAKSLLQV